MQQAQSALTIPLFKHHDVGFFGDHGRHETACMIERAMALIAANHAPKSERYQTILTALTEYNSKKGIPSELITSVFTLCLGEVVENFQDSGYKPTEKEFYVACQILDLIMQKFKEKILFKSDVLEKNFEHFSEMILKYNAFQLREEDRFQLKTHFTFFHLMECHINLSLLREGVSSISEHKNLTSVINSYRKFISKKLCPVASEVEHLSNHFHGVFESLIKFIDLFHADIHTEKALFSEITLFIHDLVKHYEIFLQFDHQAVINETVKKALENNFRLNYCVVRNANIALALKNLVVGKEAEIIVNMEQVLLSNPALEHCRLPDFYQFMNVYQYFFTKCPDDFQLQTLERNIRKSKTSHSFLYLVQYTIVNGFKYKEPYFSKYILMLKNLIAEARVVFKSIQANSKTLRFEINRSILSEICEILSMIEEKKITPEVKNLSRWVFEMACDFILKFDMENDLNQDILNKMMMLMQSAKNSESKMPTDTISRIRKFSIDHQSEKNLLNLTQLSSSLLSYRAEHELSHQYIGSI